MFQKNKTYRNSRLLELAKECPECMSCGKINNGSVVAAHSNKQCYGKGMSHKAHDWAIAYLCNECHYFVDDGKASSEERDIVWLGAHIKTLEWLFNEGYLKVGK